MTFLIGGITFCFWAINLYLVSSLHHGPLVILLHLILFANASVLNIFPLLQFYNTSHVACYVYLRILE